MMGNFFMFQKAEEGGESRGFGERVESKTKEEGLRDEFRRSGK